MRTNNPIDGIVALPGAPTQATQANKGWTGKVGILPWPKNDVAGKRIRLTHLDGKLPNLALMKMSAWFKDHGALVTFSKCVSRELFEGDYDLVLGSSIFNWSENARNIFAHNFPGAIIGGTGAEIRQVLSNSLAKITTVATIQFTRHSLRRLVFHSVAAD